MRNTMPGTAAASSGMSYSYLLCAHGGGPEAVCLCSGLVDGKWAGGRAWKTYGGRCAVHVCASRDQNSSTVSRSSARWPREGRWAFNAGYRSCRATPSAHHRKIDRISHQIEAYEKVEVENGAVQAQVGLSGPYLCLGDRVEVVCGSVGKHC